MKKRVVVALGGNALGNDLEEQWESVKRTVKVIADLVDEGLQVVITHGNGPQVGMLQTAMSEFSDSHSYAKPTPLTVCIAMSQGYIGYDLQNRMSAELEKRGRNIPVTTLITQVRVDKEDPAFLNPTKPIGRFLTEEEAKKKETENIHFVEDSGRGYRQVVASPAPQEIIELDTIKTLLDDHYIVIACGGGAVPVIRTEDGLKGIDAVVDKDYISAFLAKELDADQLIILTAVEQVALNYMKEDQEWISKMSVEEAKAYSKEGHFAPGSMLPKVEAAVQFAESKKGRETLITLLDKAKDGINGKTGTIIYS